MESMEHLENPICRLCFNVINGSTFKVIEKTIREALEVILKLNVDEKIKSVICTACSTRLFAAYQFKANCMNTENSLFPYVKPEDATPVDLRDIYLKERGKGCLGSMSNDQQICRLCMQIVTLGFVSVEDVEIDMIQNCVPEINFNCTRDPIICAACLYLLESHNNFLKEYSYVEMEIKNTYDNESPVFLKTEKIEITYEEDNENSESRLSAQDGSVDDTNQYKFLQNSTEVDSSNYSLYEHARLPHHQISHKDVYSDQAYECDVQPIHKSLSNVLSYNSSSSDYKDRPPSQQLIRKDLAEAPMHQCHACDYKTRQKSNLKVHLQRHKYFSKMEGFECDTCDYRSMLKSDLKKHTLTHKDMSETKVFECDTCDFKSKRKSNFNAHLLIHKNFSETEVFECATCGYKTKIKGNLKKHLIRHRDISTIKLFECGICGYKGKRKYDLQSHLVKHKDISEMTIFKCDVCDYKSRYKIGLSRHLFLRHKIVI